MSGTHALLSASSAVRWLNCPPSARLTQDMPDQTSEYAAEGTLAHQLGELRIRQLSGERRDATEYAALTANPLYKPEMERYIDDYVEFVQAASLDYDARPYMAIEQRLDLRRWVPEGFGTGDCILIGGGTLHIIDLKYGKGVAVHAEDNPQLKLYALGALDAYRDTGLYDVDRVRMSIVQPRLSGVSTIEMTADELYAWGEDIAPIALAAYRGEGEYREGDWCRYCRAKAQCRARAEAMTALESSAVTAPGLLAPDELARVLEVGERLAKWLDDARAWALDACLHGENIPGYKAVEGRSIRQFTDQRAAFAAALAGGVDETMLYKREPVTLAALEKTLGKQTFDSLLGQYVVMPPGKPTLARDTDRHPALIDRPSAAEDFAAQ